MRIRMLRTIASVHGSYRAGETAEVEDEVARKWIASGVAMQDKSTEPKETKYER